MSDERRRCSGLNKRGEPCGAFPLKTGDYCRAHDPNLPDEVRFGSSVQAGVAGGSPKPRYINLREALEREIEANAERIVGAQLEALEATRVTVNEETGEVHVHPDYATRLRAGDTITTRALGKPTQLTEVSGVDGGPVQIASTFDLERLSVSEKLDLLELLEKAEAADA